MLEIGRRMDRERAPACGPRDAIVRPLALAPCTSDIHTVWEGDGERRNLAWGTSARDRRRSGGEVKDFKPATGSSSRRSPPTGRRKQHSADSRRRPAARLEAGSSRIPRTVYSPSTST